MKTRVLRLAMVFALTAVVVWGSWYTEFGFGQGEEEVVSVEAAAQEPIGLPVLMYHSINSRVKKAGDYVITP